MGDIQYEDLFLGILAMDVYHRGYNSGLKDLGDALLTSIGTASIQKVTADSSIGFYAIKYAWDGNDVYVYRGTDQGFVSA